MATRRSVLGGGLQRAADSIVQAVNRKEDQDLAQTQLDVQNTQADTRLDQQQQQIGIMQQAETRMQEQAEFGNAVAIMNQIPAGTQFTLRDAAAAFPVFGSRLGNIDLAGPMGDVDFRPETMETLRIDGVQEAIAAGRAEGATPEQVMAGQTASNFAVLGVAGTDAQIEAARTNDLANLNLSTQTANAMVAAERQAPGTLAESNGVLRIPYRDPSTGQLVNTLPGLEILLKMRSLRSTSGRGSEESIIDLKDDYLAFAEAEGHAIDPATARRLSEIQLGADFSTSEGQADWLQSMAGLEAAFPGGGAMFDLAVRGGVAQNAFSGRTGDTLQELIGSVDRAENPELFNILMQMGSSDAARRANSSREAITGAIPADAGLFDTGTDEGAQAVSIQPDAGGSAASGSQLPVAGEARSAAAQAAGEQAAADFEQNRPTNAVDFARSFITQDGVASAEQIAEQAGLTRVRAGRVRKLLEKIRTGSRAAGNPNKTQAQRDRQAEINIQTRAELAELIAAPDRRRDASQDDRPDRMDIG